MSLALEFLTPLNPETSSAEIETNWCFPAIARATRATDCSGGTTARPNGSTTRDDQPASYQGNPSDSVARSPIATPTLQNCQ